MTQWYTVIYRQKGVLDFLGMSWDTWEELEYTWILEYLRSKRTMAMSREAVLVEVNYSVATCLRSFDLRQWLWRRLSSWKGGQLFCPMAPIREVLCGFSGCVFDFGCRAWQISAYKEGHAVAQLVAWQEAARSKKLTWSQYAVSIVRGLEFYAASWKSNFSFGINFKHRCFICHSLQSTGGCRPGPSLDCIGELCATGAHVLCAQTGGRCGPEGRCDDSFESLSAPADQPSHFWGFKILKQPWSYHYYHQLSIMKPTLDHYPSTINHISHISHPLTQTCAPDPMVKVFNPQPCRTRRRWFGAMEPPPWTFPGRSLVCCRKPGRNSFQVRRPTGF